MLEEHATIIADAEKGMRQDLQEIYQDAFSMSQQKTQIYLNNYKKHIDTISNRNLEVIKKQNAKSQAEVQARRKALSEQLAKSVEEETKVRENALHELRTGYMKLQEEADKYNQITFKTALVRHHEKLLEAEQHLVETQLEVYKQDMIKQIFQETANNAMLDRIVGISEILAKRTYETAGSHQIQAFKKACLAEQKKMQLETQTEVESLLDLVSSARINDLNSLSRELESRVSDQEGGKRMDVEEICRMMDHLDDMSIQRLGALKITFPALSVAQAPEVYQKRYQDLKETIVSGVEKKSAIVKNQVLETHQKEMKILSDRFDKIVGQKEEILNQSCQSPIMSSSLSSSGVWSNNFSLSDPSACKSPGNCAVVSNPICPICSELIPNLYKRIYNWTRSLSTFHSRETLEFYSETWSISTL